jgi:hypothetical protein
MNSVSWNSSWPCTQRTSPSAQTGGATSESARWGLFSLRNKTKLYKFGDDEYFGPLKTEIRTFLRQNCILQKIIMLHKYQSHDTTDGQSVSMSRCLAHSGTYDQILLSVRRLLSESRCLVSVGRPLWREVGSVICHSQFVVIYQYFCTLRIYVSSVS